VAFREAPLPCSSKLILQDSFALLCLSVAFREAPLGLGVALGVRVRVRCRVRIRFSCLVGSASNYLSVRLTHLFR
jgi:hypothetical protein